MTHILMTTSLVLWIAATCLVTAAVTSAVWWWFFETQRWNLRVARSGLSNMQAQWECDGRVIGELYFTNAALERLRDDYRLHFNVARDDLDACRKSLESLKRQSKNSHLDADGPVDQ